MANRTIAIGDIHGCLAALDALLGEINPGPEDVLVTLGDYVDRGPDSRGVLERLLELRGRTALVTLLGNHEEMMLRVLSGEAPATWWLRYGGAETLDSYGFDGDLSVVPEAHTALLESCKDWHETEGCFFVHANYVADEPLDHQPAEALRWLSLLEKFPDRHTSGKTAVLGHTAQKHGEVLDAGYLKCIDTYCHGGGWLTALEPSTGRVWQADRAGRLR